MGGMVDPNARPFLYDTAAYLPEKLPGDPAKVEEAARALAAAMLRQGGPAARGDPHPAERKLCRSSPRKRRGL